MSDTNYETNTLPPKRTQAFHPKVIVSWYDRLTKEELKDYEIAYQATNPNALQSLIVKMAKELTSLTRELAGQPGIKVSIGGRDYWTGVRLVKE